MGLTYWGMIIIYIYNVVVTAHSLIMVSLVMPVLITKTM